MRCLAGRTPRSNHYQYGKKRRNEHTRHVVPLLITFAAS
jgi:hypothetical protein